jgi:hypothetical protein
MFDTYCDGKDIHIFRDRSVRVGYECNKHRLKMFHSTEERVMQIAVDTVRSAVKIWEQLSLEGTGKMPIPQ